MKLKSYFAATVESAMNLASLELGPDAMLVSTRRTGEDARHMGEYEVVFAASASQEPRSIGFAAGSHAKAPAMDKLSDEVAGLKREMERLASALARSSAGVAKIMANADLAEAFARLVDAEMDADLAQDIVLRVGSQIENAHIPRTDWGALIASELSRLLPVDSRPPGASGRSAIALVGPPGVGKTATLVKLAVLYGLGTRRPSQILSLDTRRVAATEPLRSYASITGLAFRAIETPRAVFQALEECRSKELVFIDTPGLSRAELEESADLAKAIARHEAIETHLVLSASMKPADMKRMVQQYEIFAPTKLIFTHLDETETFGPLLNLPVRTGKPISFLSRGQQIPEDLESADARTLVELVLKESQQGEDELRSTAAA